MLAEQREAVHFCFDEAAAMMAVPLLPDGAPVPLDRTERFIAGSRARAILLPWTLKERICLLGIPALVHKQLHCQLPRRQIFQDLLRATANGIDFYFTINTLNLAAANKSGPT